MDLELFRTINLGWRNPFFDVLFAALSYSGLGAAVGLVALAYAMKKDTRVLGFAIGLGAIIGGTLLGQTFKTLMPRDRPSNLSFAITQESHKKASFPSSHTSCAFGVATALGILAVRRRKWGVVTGIYVWATGVGLSRIYRGVHYPTDVLGGALLGIVGGCVAILIIDRAMNHPLIESPANGG